MKAIRNFLFVFVFCLAAIISSRAEETSPVARKPNVLFIMSDDLTCLLHCYGVKEMKTPNIDNLAKRGVLFERAYCQFPLCNPSRASIMTGRRPDTTKVFGNQLFFRKTLPNVVTLPEMFKKNGYFSARVGKIFHYGVPSQIGTSGMDDPQSWNEFVNPRGHDKDVEDKVINYIPGKKLGASLCWYDDETNDLVETDGKVATEAIRLLEEHKDKPFFIAAGFYRPHVPEVAPNEYYNWYPLEKVTLPDEPRKHLASVPMMAFNVRPTNYGLPPEDLRRFKRGYMASVSFMDAQVGRLLDTLDRLNLADNTIVVFMSDHGWLLGQHGQWQKMSLFEDCARVPMIFYVPNGKGNGRSSKRTVELIDVYPTLAELCGLEIPPGFEGKSFATLLEKPNAAWDKPALTQVSNGDRNGRSVRTERWRYTEWDGGKAGAELYDHRWDPHELKNLAKNPRYNRTIEELKKLLHGEGAEK
jgi:uncharacterized sulfatase